jgi:hypothetical protein
MTKELDCRRTRKLVLDDWAYRQLGSWQIPHDDKRTYQALGIPIELL